MAAIQQVLFAIQSIALGTTFLENSFTTTATSISYTDANAQADLALTLGIDGSLNVISTRIGNHIPGFVDPALTEVIKSYNWLTDGTESLYSVRVVRNSGELDFFRATGQSDSISEWLPMSQARSWMIRSTAPPNVGSTINFTLQIALSIELSRILASGTFDFTCDAQSRSGDIP
jgi:hypothetical protein